MENAISQRAQGHLSEQRAYKNHVIPSVVEESPKQATGRPKIVKPMPYNVYILSNQWNSVLYIGVTNDLERRIAEHKSEAIDGFSKKYQTHKLVYTEEYSDVKEAIAREKQLKRWSRGKKEMLINALNPSWQDLAEE